MSFLSSFSNGTLPLVQQQLVRYGYSTLIVFGVSGCCLNILLLSRRQFQTSSCCTYFQAVSLISLIHIGFAQGLYLYALNHTDPVATYTLWCKLRFYFAQSTSLMYRWCLTIACFDRFALSSTSVRLRNFAQVKTARRVLGVIVIVCLASPVYVPVLYSLRFNICSIYYSIGTAMFHSAFVTLTSCIVPMATMSTCALLIRRNLAQKRQRLEQITANGNQTQKLQSKRDQQVLVMLLVQMLFYGATIIPLMIMYFYSAATIYITKPLDRIIVERFLFFSAEMINMLFPVCSFYLYTMASRMFRVELKAMLFSCFHGQWAENNSRVRPGTQELRGRAQPDSLIASKAAGGAGASDARNDDSLTNANCPQPAQA